jgi:hypothetical protein
MSTCSNKHRRDFALMHIQEWKEPIEGLVEKQRVAGKKISLLSEPLESVRKGKERG